MSYKGDNLMSVKRTNRSVALRALHEKGAMSRKRLAESMNLTPAAITKIVGEMISDGLLSEGEMLASGNAGRREILVDINTQADCGLGVLIGMIVFDYAYEPRPAFEGGNHYLAPGLRF